MFESDIERSKIRLLELVNSTQPTVYLNDILGRASIDYAYKQFFEAEFGWWLYEEQTLRQTNPNLDLHDAETLEILGNLDSQYRKHARFDREQLMLIIDSAVKSVLNYRVRPRTTLKWFVFRGEPTKPIYEVFLRMRYFADYRYLHEGFNQWLLKRGLRHDSLDIISVLEFERLIKKIDDDTILELSPSQFVDLISPINYFFAELSADPTKQSIPIEAVIIFLDDKEIYIIAQKLELMLYQHGVRQLTKEMFLQVVDEVLNEIEGDGSHDADPSTDEAASPTPDEHIARVSTSDLLRPSGNADSEGILRTRSVVPDTIVHSAPEIATTSPAQAGFGGASKLAAAASAVSVIEALSRKGEQSAEEATAQTATAPPSSAPASSDATPSRSEQLSGLQNMKDATSLFVKDDSTSTDTSSRPGFVVNENEDVDHDLEISRSTAVEAEQQAIPSESTPQTARAESATPAPVQDMHSGSEQNSSALEELGRTLTAERAEYAAHHGDHSDRGEHADLEEHDVHADATSQSHWPEAHPVTTESLSAESKIEQVEQSVERSFTQSPASVNAEREKLSAQSELSDHSSQPILGIITRALSTPSQDKGAEVLTSEDHHDAQDDRQHDGDLSLNPVNETLTAESLQTSTASRTYPSIHEIYDQRQRDNYIKRLCSKDEQRFDDLLASIDQTRNWKEALAYLDRFYSQNNVDPQSSVARDFRMSVYKRFIVS